MNRINMDLLKRTVEHHQKWLTGDYPTPANFCHKGLWRADFSGLNLSYANFVGANLKRVNFSGADLSYANFKRANLKAVNFTGANLTGTIFVSASMPQAQLKETTMERTDFNRADLTGAHLTEGCEQNCDFTKANLTGTCLSPNDSHMVFYLDEKDGEIHLMVTKERNSYLLLTITKAGTLRRAKNVPLHLGFHLDTEKRIALLN